VDGLGQEFLGLGDQAGQCVQVDGGVAAIAQALNSAAENLRMKIVINRVAQRVLPPQPLVDNTLRKRLANDSVNLEEFINAVAERLMTPAELKAQITTAWKEAETDVGNHRGDTLLEIAPGEEILTALFRQYTNRRYDKRVHGPAIAAAMNPPAELTELFSNFVAD
jgi:microcompartment protein CcmL/EutN